MMSFFFFSQANAFCVFQWTKAPWREIGLFSKPIFAFSLYFEKGLLVMVNPYLLVIKSGFPFTLYKLLLKENFKLSSFI